jgi:hypothetical protein
MKAGQVTASLRQRVIAGQLRPGQRLPTWNEMEGEFGVGRPTLMRALARLKQDGLVVADSTRGTYVADRPPHLYRYGLVFSEGPGQSGWNRFWAGLDSDAVALARATNRELPPFYWTEPHPDNESYLRLLREAHAGRLAGLIVVGGGPMIEPGAIEAIGLPVVAIQAKWPAPSGVPIFDSDFDSFINLALRALQVQGRRRPAVLTNVYNPMDRITARLAEFGMSARPSWMQGVDTHHPKWAGQIIRLLLDQTQTDRPDSLVITDDNLAESALAAIVELGVRVPQDLLIVTHSNFQHPVTAVVPMLRLGFHSGKMLGMAIKTIDRLRAKLPVSMKQLLAAESLDAPL